MHNFAAVVRMRSHELDFYSRFVFAGGGGGGVRSFRIENHKSHFSCSLAQSSGWLANSVCSCTTFGTASTVSVHALRLVQHQQCLFMHYVW